MLNTSIIKYILRSLLSILLPYTHLSIQRTIGKYSTTLYWAKINTLSARINSCSANFIPYPNILLLVNNSYLYEIKEYVQLYIYRKYIILIYYLLSRLYSHQDLQIQMLQKKLCTLSNNIKIQKIV